MKLLNFYFALQHFIKNFHLNKFFKVLQLCELTECIFLIRLLEERLIYEVKQFVES